MVRIGRSRRWPQLLERVIGEDDLVGVMTPEMSARNVTYSPRTAPVAQMLAANWAWGERGSATPSDPRENDLKMCYPDVDGTAGVAQALIDRRRQQKTLDALDDLLDELERQREQRSFVLLLSEGWTLPPADERLARALPTPGGGTIMPGGRSRSTPARTAASRCGRPTRVPAACSRASASDRCWRWPTCRWSSTG